MKEVNLVFEYIVVKEDPYTGERGKRKRKIFRREPLEVGGLYVHLGREFPGAYRILEEIK